MSKRRRAVSVLLAGVVCTSVGMGCRSERDRGDADRARSDDASAPETETPTRPLPLAAPDSSGPSAYEAWAEDPDAVRDHRSEVLVVTTELASVPMLIPSTVVVAAGPDQRLRLENQGREDRRFVIDGLGVATNVPAGQQETIHLPRLEPNSIYAIRIETAAPGATNSEPPPSAETPGGASNGAVSPGTPGAPAASAGQPTEGSDAGASEPVEGTLVVLGPRQNERPSS